jgi:NlpC/P60 family
MEKSEQADSQAWSLWAKLTRPVLLRCPVLGMSAVLVVTTPLAATAWPLPGAETSASSQPTQRQLRVLRSYERYLSRVRAQSARAARAVKFAYRQIGKPYQWGGAGPRTYDCSGLAMAAWRRGGLSLPHRADLQHHIIRRKVGLKHLRPGDLVFFSGNHHVGIYVGHRHFLHAPHTGARVQRGTLSGWRVRVFAGAARPGAPAFHAWPHWVRSLARHLKKHGASSTPRPRGKENVAPSPAPTYETDTGDLGTWPWQDRPPFAGVGAYPPDQSSAAAGVPAQVGADGRQAAPASGVEREHPMPSLPGASRPPFTVVDEPEESPVGARGMPLLGGPIVWLTGHSPAGRAPAAGDSARSVPAGDSVRRPSAAEPVPAESAGRPASGSAGRPASGPVGRPASGPAGSSTRPTGAVMAPVPPPPVHGRADSRPVAHHPWPRTSVQTDTDRYNYDSDLDGDEGGDLDQSPLPGLLRPDEQLPALLKGL